MGRFVRTLAIACVLCGGSAPALAQPGLTPAKPAAADLPPAEEIFERFVEAMGGREAMEKITSRRIRGTFEGGPFQFKANLQVWWEADGRFHQRVAEPAGLRYDVFLNGDYTWYTVGDGEPMPMTGAQRQELYDTADFYGEANYRNRYSEMRTASLSTADGRKVYVVNVRTKAGRPMTHYFDQESGLLVATRVPSSDEKGTLRDMIVRLGDYREFGGVLYPTRVQQQFKDEQKTNEYIYTTIEVNVEDDHDYSVPESVRRAFDAAREQGVDVETGLESDG